MWPLLTAQKKNATSLDLEPLHLGENEQPSDRSKVSCERNDVLRTIAYILLLLAGAVLVYETCCPNDRMQWENDERCSCYDKEYATDIEVLQQYRQQFEDYLVSFDKEYDEVEKTYRLSVFAHNMKENERVESEEPGLDLDATQFTDWTDKELREYLQHSSYDTVIEGSTRYDERVLMEGESRPLDVDWRNKGKVTAVKDQGQCGSCWAFATVAAVESQQAIKSGELEQLAEQELVDCDRRNSGCHGGYRPYAMAFVKSHGLIKQSAYPYTGKEGDECKQHNQTRVHINDYKILSSNEGTIADWVSKNGPVTFGMNVTREMYNYRSGVFNPSRRSCTEQSMGSHAVTIVGYGSESGKDYWLVKNSWGSRWGQGGYFKLARGVNSCGAANIVVAAIIS